jgi:serine/threonine protein kinase
MTAVYLNALPKGTMLGEYEIHRVLGAGGFGITYLAMDNNLDKAVAIKEYLPSDCAVRLDGSTVQAKASNVQDDFEWGLDKFMKEAKTLGKFRHPNIIGVKRFFEANATGYIVMDYAEGDTLTDRLNNEGVMSEDQIKPIILALADGLKQCHDNGVLHRDIKPSNIILQDDNTPVLIDFGAARADMGSRHESSVAIASHGYAPLEQYGTGGAQGVWTDIYALGAVAYKSMVGETPPEATSRARNDPYVSALKAAKGKGSAHFLKAIDWALMPFEEDRPQVLDAWLGAISGEIDADTKVATKPGPAKTKPVVPEVEVTLPPPRPNEGSRTVKLIAAIAIVALIAATLPYALEYWNSGRDDQAWSEASAERTVASVDAYRSNFRDGEHIDEANALREILVAEEDARLDAAAWATASAADSVDSYEAYLDEFPRGAHAADALQRIDELSEPTAEELEAAAWARAQRTNTIEGFLEYLAAWSAGAHAGDANARLMDLSAHDGQSVVNRVVQNVNIREWPSTSATRLVEMPANTTFLVNGKVLIRDWLNITTNNGAGGYLASSLAQPLSDDSGGSTSGGSTSGGSTSGGSNSGGYTGSGIAGADDSRPIGFPANLNSAEVQSRLEMRRRWSNAIRRRGG